ncbi:orotidine-5'-phosphate decarboxylase [Candidatus Poriferisodalis sp.]|uniref:orotidine-5'-phosphate decarboxylase n=1 Tax=Candidatus Poriferisodalis sp. TaxID=3101277 RepID=UPI003D1351E8
MPSRACELAPLRAANAARDRLVLALDVADPAAAVELAQAMKPSFGVMKVGLELFIAGGPDIVTDVLATGCRVFLDLKLHDIPNTVERAAKRAGALGVSFLTIHTQGGADMLAAGARGLTAGAADGPRTPSAPTVLGVTVLTSDRDAPEGVLAERAAMAKRAGCGGVICAAADLGVVSNAAPGLLRVVPGIRPAGVAAMDQGRVATPSAALSAGADLLVIGRAVTAASDPLAAAAAILAESGGALDGA